jgi:hypothetical protein
MCGVVLSAPQPEPNILLRDLKKQGAGFSAERKGFQRLNRILKTTEMPLTVQAVNIIAV